MYSNHKNTIFKNGISTTPTISVRNLPIIKTGANVSGQGSTGIPNFHFVDREEDRAYYFFGNDALLLEEIARKKGLISMFERLQGFKTMNCSAQFDWDAHFTIEPLLNLAIGETSRDFGEALCFQELMERAKNENKIRELRTGLIKKIQYLKKLPWWLRLVEFSRKRVIEQTIHKISKLDDRTLPDFFTAYIPWPDHYAHYKGPFSDEIISPTGELNRLDYWLSKYQKAYEVAGVYDKTLFSMAGDHGLSPIYYSLNPEVEVFNKFQKETGRKLIIKKISSDEGEAPKLTNALDPPSNKGIDVIVASTAGGNYMMDFFKDQGENWKNQPNYHDLINWMPLSSGDSVDIISEIVNRLNHSLDYLVVRESKPGTELVETRIIGTRKGKRYDEIIKRKNGRFFYYGVNHQIENLSLLDINSKNKYINSYKTQDMEEHDALIEKCVRDAKENDFDSWCSEIEWRNLTRTTNRPDSVTQLSFIYDSSRAGTVNLFPKYGIGYNTTVPGRHAGESFHEKDSFVGFWGTPTNKEERLKSGINASIAPTVYQYLTGKPALAGKNGWGFSGHLKSISK